MIVTDNIEYAELYLTFRCNLKCSYCINGDILRQIDEIPANILADSINKTIEFKNIPLTIGGGEPTIRKDFYELINGLNDSIKIDLLTNGNFDEREFITKIPLSRMSIGFKKSYKSIRVSYHTTQDKIKLVKKVKYLQDNGFSIGIFGIAHPENIYDNVDMAQLCSENNVFFFIKEFLGMYNNILYGTFMHPEALDGIKKKVNCKTSELLISPTGSIHRCHRDLYNLENSLGNIVTDFKETSKTDLIKYTYCDNFGLCNMCDLKIKINRTLTTSRCSITINKITNGEQNA